MERYNEKYPNTEKVFFLNIEFRLSDSIDAKNKNPNIHVIFDNDDNVCPKSKIDSFLSELKVYEEDDHCVRLSCSGLVTTHNYEAASVSFIDLQKALKDTFGESKPYLIVFPAKNDGIKTTDTGSPRKVIISDIIDKKSDFFFGDKSSTDYFLRSDRYDNGAISDPKAVVSCSDAHSFDDLRRLDGNINGFPPTWIKADLTFRGLQQICYEQKCRIHIDDEPEIYQRKSLEPTRFISHLSINQKEGYNESNGVWFKNIEMPISSELTVIIGNKGSGKSAVADIMGLLCDSKQHDYFSFLSNNKQNKKFKQKGYAENFEATLTWESGEKIKKDINEGVDFTKPETIRYLPQNYFEQLTNEIEIKSFRKEIEDVVFSHVSSADRMGKKSFEELREFNTHQSKQEISAYKAQVREINREIIELENKSIPEFKQQLEEQLKIKEKELEALNNSKPEEASKPDTETDEQRQISQEISDLTEDRKNLKSKLTDLIDALSNNNAQLRTLSDLLDRVKRLDTSLSDNISELKIISDGLGLDIRNIVSKGIDTATIDTKIKETQQLIDGLNKDNSQSIKVTDDFTQIYSIPDVDAAVRVIDDKLEQQKEKLGEPQKIYQLYLERLQKWQQHKEMIIGESDASDNQNIKSLAEQISYIEDELENIKTEKYAVRASLLEKVFLCKNKELNFFTQLKSSVKERLQAVQTDDFSVDIMASFVLESSFQDDFLRHVNKKKKGSFNSVNGAIETLKELMSDIIWNNFKSVNDFIQSVLSALTTSNGEKLLVSDQVNNVKEFYDFLYSLEYLSVKYELRSRDKNLDVLSPGEKGLLLLIFYLQLDKHKTPLVIDQPEDNLDNDSIYKVLANCIREAKKRRQVILVTHNPNLAIGADAEQVICVGLDKRNKYTFSYESGSIENPIINDRIVLILEGSQPAFVKRRLKYNIK